MQKYTGSVSTPRNFGACVTEVILIAMILDSAAAFSYSGASPGVHLSTSANRQFRFGIARHTSPVMNIAGDRSEMKWCDRREILFSTLSAGIMVAGMSQPADAIGKVSGDLVLVVGATSTTGQDACKDLIAMGYKVRGFTRRAEDVQKAVIGTEFAQVEWVNGDLKEFSDLAPAMKGVKKVLFTPLLATRAGSDPTYFKETVSEDIELSRLVYSEAVGELIRLGKKEGIDKFVLVSSASVGMKMSLPELVLDERKLRADEAQGRWRPTRLEPALLNEDVIKWKLRGEQMLKQSGLPYTIVRAFSPPPRPWNDPKPEDFNVAIFQADAPKVSGALTRSDLGRVAAEALARPETVGTTFEAINVPKDLAADKLMLLKKFNPKFPEWKESIKTLVKDAPVSQSSFAIGDGERIASTWQGDTLSVGKSESTQAKDAQWEGDTFIIKKLPAKN